MSANGSNSGFLVDGSSSQYLFIVVKIFFFYFFVIVIGESVINLTFKSVTNQGQVLFDLVYISFIGWFQRIIKLGKHFYVTI